MSVESSILFVAGPCPQLKAVAEALAQGSDYRVIMATHDGRGN